MWALRWRNQAQVQAIAADLGWYAAAELTGQEVLSAADLGVTIRHAFLDEIAEMKNLSGRHGGDNDIGSYDAVPHLARMLEWLIRPSAAGGRADAHGHRAGLAMAACVAVTAVALYALLLSSSLRLPQRPAGSRQWPSGFTPMGPRIAC